MVVQHREGCDRSCAIRRSVQRNRMACPSAITTKRLKQKPRPHPEDANGVFHAFTSRKVAALEMRTTEGQLRSGQSRIFSGSDGALRRQCRPGVTQRLSVVFLPFSFEFLLRFPETRHACCDLGSLSREPIFLVRHRRSVSFIARSLDSHFVRLAGPIGA